MNFIKFISLVLLIIDIHSDIVNYNPCNLEEYTKNGVKLLRVFEPKNGDDCKSRSILEYVDRYYYNGEKAEDKIKTYYSHCCYITYDRIKEDKNYRDSEGKEYGVDGYCERLTDSQYKNVKDFANYLSFDNTRSNYKIDCKSNYLKFGLFSLMILILF